MGLGHFRPARVAEASGLIEHFAEPAVPHAHREAERAVAEIDVLDMRDAGRQPVGQRMRKRAELEVVGVAHEVQDAVARIHVESHAQAGGQGFDQRAFARQALDAFDDAGFAAWKLVDALPGRAAVRRREDVDGGRDVRARERRDGRAEQPAARREQLAREAGADFVEDCLDTRRSLHARRSALAPLPAGRTTRSRPTACGCPTLAG